MAGPVDQYRDSNLKIECWQDFDYLGIFGVVSISHWNLTCYEGKSQRGNI